jgi:hypothetical protein
MGGDTDLCFATLAPGQALARGVCRWMCSMDFAAVTEFVPARGLRMDVIALGPRGEIWGVECKSSRSDFTSDQKWHDYLLWCDRFFWAVPAEFPQALLPAGGGIIRADGFGAEILREGEESPLASARRRALTLRFARLAAWRHTGLAGME